MFRTTAVLQWVCILTIACGYSLGCSDSGDTGESSSATSNATSSNATSSNATSNATSSSSNGTTNSNTSNTTSTECGNGTCEDGEDADNCASDCEVDATGCAAVPVCGGDANCHFMVGEVDGLSVSCSNASGSWVLSVVATGLPQHGYGGNNATDQEYEIDIPLEPAINASDATSCPDNDRGVVGMQGIMINGVAIHRSLTPELTDPVNPPEGGAEPPIDPCDGHGTNSGQYHYHTLPLCLFGTFDENGEETFGVGVRVVETSWDRGLWEGPSGVIGFSLAGYPVYGPYADANKTRHTGLDACNGKLSADGSQYAYYVTDTYPYMLGCVGPGKALSDTTPEDWACTTAPPIDN